MSDQLDADVSRAGLDFLQRRIATFGLVAAGINGLFWLFRLGLVIAVRDYEYLLSEVSFWLHGGAVVAFLGIWALLRDKPRSMRFIQSTELIGFAGACGLYELMAAFIGTAARPDLIVILALTFLIFTRAIYVPSSGRRTALLGLLIGLPLVATVFWIYRDFDFTLLTGIASEEAESGLAITVTSAAVWWTCSVSVSVAASKVLGELRATQMRLVETQSHSLLVRLVAGIAHEANTPLGALTSSADTIDRALEKTIQSLETGDSAKALKAAHLGRGLTETVKSSSARISTLVDNLKRFVNLDNAEFREIDVRNNLDSAVVVIMPSAGDAITIVRTYPDQPVMVRCFPARINNALLNVLQNAVEAFAGPGQIHLSIQVVGPTVIVQIQDSGRGMPASDLTRIFEIGFSAKQREGRVGLRLGLPYTKRVLQELGGAIEIESRPGSGTTVTLRLPRSNSMTPATT